MSEKRMNKQAQLGSTISWFVGFIVVFLATLIYFALVVGIAATDIHRSTIEGIEGASKLSDVSYIGFADVDKIPFSREPPQVLKDFLEESKQQVDDFVDSEHVLSQVEYQEVKDKNFNVDIDAVQVYQRFFSRYNAYMLDKDFSQYYFYIRTGPKEMEIFSYGDADDRKLDWRMDDRGIEDQFIYDLKPTDPNLQSPDSMVQAANENRFYFITDEGNLYMIIFYDNDALLEIERR